MRRRGKLSDEELALWVHVASQVRPLPGRKLPVVPRQAADGANKADAITFTPVAPIPPAGQSRIPPMAPIERRLRQRVTRGQAPIDGVLDLHGMRQDEAHRALLQFVQRKHHEGAAVVMIITGKGNTGRDAGIFRDGGSGTSERGVLKRLVPHWLTDPGLRRCVIGFEDAAHHHGGTGALYVRIRRARELM